MTASNGQHPIIFQKKPWSHNDNSAWLASTVCFHRNIEKHKFPGKLPEERKKQIVSLVSKELTSKEMGNTLKRPVLLKSEEITALEKEFLVEHFLSTQNFTQTGSGEGFLLDESGEFLGIINLEDHIHLQLVDCKGEIESAWSRLVKIESALGKAINYSFQPKFGFLTADPTLCGTALVVTVYLQLAGLIHSGTIDDTLDALADESITISGIQGNPNEIIGDVIMAQNTYTLGMTEEAIVSSLRNFTTKILVEETSIRNQIKKDGNPDFKDRVSRAYGILIHSYQIEAVEALNALSLLKLGVEAGWVSGITNKEINALFFNCRRAHMLHQCPEKLPQEEIPHKRAEQIHHALKVVKLLI